MWHESEIYNSYIKQCGKLKMSKYELVTCRWETLLVHLQMLISDSDLEMEMEMICWMCVVIWRDRYSCEELRAQVGIKSIVDVICQRHLAVVWSHRKDDSWLKKMQNLEWIDVCGRDRPHETWEHVIMEDLSIKGLMRACSESYSMDVCYYMNSPTQSCMD